MVRMIIALLITAALSVSCGPSKMAKPLQAGMPNTITLANGQVVFDLNGDWGGIYDLERFGTYETYKEIVRITQKGDQFVGIKLIGSPYVGKNEKTIKGKLKKNRFKEVNVKSTYGWFTGWGKISENGNKIEIRASLQYGNVTITLQRK